MPTHTRRPRTRATHAVWLAALALTAAGTAACSADDSAAAGLEPSLTLEVVGTDTLEFEPAAWAVPAGEAIELTLDAEPAVEHDFLVEDVGVAGSAFPQDGGHSHDDLTPADLHIAHADAGGRAVSLFTITEPGTYEVYCSIPGHREAGMVGTLAVVE